MNKNTETTVKHLATGDRFYRKTDRHKIVYQKMEAHPAHNIDGNPYWCCPIMIVDDTAMEDRRKPHYYQLVQAHERVIYIGNEND